MAIFSCPAVPAWLRAIAIHLGLGRQYLSDRGPAELPDNRDRYRLAVATLPAGIRTIYLLHRADGFSIAQIAARTGRSSGEIEHDIAEAILAIWRALDGDQV